MSGEEMVETAKSPVYILPLRSCSSAYLRYLTKLAFVCEGRLKLPRIPPQRGIHGLSSTM